MRQGNGQISGQEIRTAPGHIFFGRMRGFDQIWHGSVAQYDKMSFENAIELMEIYPETAGKDPRPLMEASVHTLVTDIIEVAEDGMSARGSFITPGVIHSTLTPDKKKYCNVLWERYGSDFVCEDGKWKYLHEQVCPDILSRMDCLNWAAEEYARITAPEKKEAPPGHTWGSIRHGDRSGAAAFALLCSWKAAEHSAMAGAVPYTG